MTNMNILIVDDEQSQRNILADILKDSGYVVSVAADGEQALQKFARHKYPVVLTDLKMPGKDGLDVLNGVKELNPDTQVIIMTAFGTIPGAVNAIKNGAYDYLTKPFKKEELIQVVRRVCEKIALLEENDRLKNEVSSLYSYGNIVGRSKKMQHIYKMIERAACVDATVLISGESGTGKELVAKAIHYNGTRKDKPFVAINCGAIPETLIESELFGYEKGAFTGALKRHTGKFEQAQDGTIFLDEIGTMRPDLQTRLLRVLQEKKIERLGSGLSKALDVRVIAATNENLEQKMYHGKFRQDLYHRLNVFTIELPVLRDRREDIPLLVRHFTEKYAGQYNKKIPSVTPEALSKLESYSFPGNVRELENIIEKTMILTENDCIHEQDLMLSENIELEMPETEQQKASLMDVEYNLIYEALSHCQGSIKNASARLGISYKTLQYRMKKYNLNKSDFKVI